MKRTSMYICFIIIVASIFLTCSCNNIINSTSQESTNTTTNTIPEEIVVTFETNGGSEISNRIIAPNSLLFRPDNPQKEGYRFDGWYTDSSFGSLYDFGTILESSITLYAKWVKVFTVSFVNYDDSVIETYEVDEGESVSYDGETPLKDLKDGNKYVFSGWDKNANNVNNDMTIKATFTQTQFLENLFTYNLSNDKSYYDIVGFNGTEKYDVITIPNEYNGLPVKGIFSCRISTRKLIIPEGITTIGSSAVDGCDSFMNVEIPNSLTSINYDSFTNTHLEFNVIDNLRYLGNKTNPYLCLCSAFDYSITNCKVRDNCKFIFNRAFSDCKSLISVEMPDSVIYLGPNAFGVCESLKNVRLSNSLTSIDDSMFVRCESLTDIVIPNSVTSIGENAFWGCKSLTKMIIPNGVTSIGISAFDGCTSLTNVELPNSITTIAHNAFANCPLSNFTEYNNGYYLGNQTNPYICLYSAKNTSITTCEINNNCRFIYDSAFKNCALLTSIELPNSVTSIGISAFDNCTSLANIEIPNSVTSIGAGAFKKCTSLASIELPDSVTSIGGSAFDNCTSLANIEIPNSVTSIGSFAFNGCYSLIDIKLSNSLDEIIDFLFYSCSALTSIEIPNNVKSIGDYAFYNCTSLTNIELPNSITYISDSTLNGCTMLQYNEYNNGYYLGNQTTPYLVLHSINDKNITSYAINSNCRIICKNVFSDCTSLTCIELPNSLVNIGDFAFSDCTSLSSVKVSDNLAYIGDSAFYRCSSLTSIELPDSVLNMGHSAFSGCTSLESVKLSAGLDIINRYMFSNCISLTNIEIASNVKSIAHYVFENCTSLKNLVIPCSVTTIGENAFVGSNNLENIYYEGTLYDWNKIWTNEIVKESTKNLYVRDENGTVEYNGVKYSLVV